MDYISGYTMILPLVLGLGVFYFYPIFKVFYDSFHEVGAFNKTKWVGLEKLHTNVSRFNNVACTI